MHGSVFDKRKTLPSTFSLQSSAADNAITIPLYRTSITMKQRAQQDSPEDPSPNAACWCTKEDGISAQPSFLEFPHWLEEEARMNGSHNDGRNGNHPNTSSQ
jgi:hypothetical protein